MSNNLEKRADLPMEGSAMTTAQMRKAEIDAFIEGKKADQKLAETNLAIAKEGTETARLNKEICDQTTSHQDKLLSRGSFLSDKERTACIIFMFVSAAFYAAIGIYILLH